mmetsp:Transcript_31926/g.53362  ORF Transcript_31926/g.53362 Transcript_31926/m.53362 type:complete len:278 (+) Transcript_31926:119-952(+)
MLFVVSVGYLGTTKGLVRREVQCNKHLPTKGLQIYPHLHHQANCRQNNIKHPPRYKAVQLASSFSTMHAPVRRNTKDAQGNFLSMNIPRPTVIGAYNAAMGGVDIFDQWGSYYDDRFRSLTWQMRLFLHFFRASVINARILYNSHKNKDITLLQFMMLLIPELCEPVNGVRSNIVGSPHEWTEGQKHGRRWWENEFIRRSTGQHTPAMVSYRKTKMGGATEPDDIKDRRKHCKVCGDPTRYYCKECGAFMHIEGDNGPDCWGVFHFCNKFPPRNNEP